MTRPRLPDSWVDRIFFRLLGTYGSQFTMTFSKVDDKGRDIGMMAAKEVWAQELGGFADRDKVIAYALDNLPERCPNAIVFRDICRRAPYDALYPVKSLEHKEEEPSKEVCEQRLKQLKEMLNAGIKPI